MAEIYRVSGSNDGDLLGDVVFVHGLNGGRRKSWDSGGADGFWPNWLAEDYQSLGVWTVNYEAAATSWRGGAMPLYDRASNILASLKAKGLGKKPICFIAHSMGGLVVKKMLQVAAGRSSEFHDFCSQTRGVIFLATPHTGSALATWAAYLGFFLRTTVATHELKDNIAALRELDDWYRENTSELNIKTQAFFESVPTRGALVVDEVSANPHLSHVTPIRVDTDHEGIAKLRSRDDFVYGRITGFVMEVLAPYPTARADSHGTSPSRSSTAAKDEIVLFPSNVLSKGGSITCLSWSPDGQEVAFAADGNHVYVCNPFSKKVSQLIWHDQLKKVTAVVWSPDGKIIAAGLSTGAIVLWEARSRKRLRQFRSQSDAVISLAWSPEGRLLASGSLNASLQMWDATTGAIEGTVPVHTSPIRCLTWSPDGEVLASGSDDATICLWRRSTKAFDVLSGHTSEIVTLAWSPDGHLLASGSDDRTIGIWDTARSLPVISLERHIEAVTGLAFTPDGLDLISIDQSGLFTVWNREWNMKTDGKLFMPAFREIIESPSFYLDKSLLATGHGGEVRVWNVKAALAVEYDYPMIHYTNAKVILIGETGVGKTGLALVISGQPFRPTDSTHGRHVSVLESQEVHLEDGRTELRETLLWDLAGQPGYRIIHQLHLTEVTVALVVFDAKNETNPFDNIQFWDRALKQAQRFKGASVPDVKKILVAARIDRGQIAVTPDRVNKYATEMGFERYIATSANDGRGIEALATAIKESIDWTKLPKGSSPELFQKIKNYILDCKESGLLLPTVDTLRHGFSKYEAVADTMDFKAEFETCIRLMESRDLIMRLDFGDYVLLQPEILDAYASALVHAAREEPNGLGSISEQQVLSGEFIVPEDARISDIRQERLLRIAMVEDLLRHEIALREHASDGSYLIFPAQVTQMHPDMPKEIEGIETIFGFQGNVQAIYAALAVRLAHSGMFRLLKFWRNAATYTAAHGVVGMFLEENEGDGTLSLFYDNEVGKDTRVIFEDFVEAHLKRKALPHSVTRQPIIVCGNCGYTVEPILYKRWNAGVQRQRPCPDCGEMLSLDNRTKSAPTHAVIRDMDKSADIVRDREAIASLLEGKRAANAFDAFIWYEDRYSEAALAIAERLEARGILTCLPVGQVKSGWKWQRGVGRKIDAIKSVVVICGDRGINRSLYPQVEGLVGSFIERGCPVIPIVLDGGYLYAETLTNLAGRNIIDFEASRPDPLDELVFRITGERVTGFKK